MFARFPRSVCQQAKRVLPWVLQGQMFYRVKCLLPSYHIMLLYLQMRRKHTAFCCRHRYYWLYIECIRIHILIFRLCDSLWLDSDQSVLIYLNFLGIVSMGDHVG